MTEGLLQYLENFLTDQRKNRIEAILANRTRRVTLVLEDLLDPHNASACLRSAEACGIQDVHIVENRHNFQVKTGVSMGSARWLTIRRYRSDLLGVADPSPMATLPILDFPVDSNDATTRCLSDLREKGYRIYATSPHENSIELPELDPSVPAAIVFGSEKDGISGTARQMADQCLRIPMYGFTESYNISVSAAITLYDVTMRMRNSTYNWHLSDKEKEELRLLWVRQSLRRSEFLEKQFRREQNASTHTMDD